jgi:hypothetical protein
MAMMILVEFTKVRCHGTVMGVSKCSCNARLLLFCSPMRATVTILYMDDAVTVEEILESNSVALVSF